MMMQRWLITTQRQHPDTGVQIFSNIELRDCHPIDWMNRENAEGRRCVLLHALKLRDGDPSLDT